MGSTVRHCHYSVGCGVGWSHHSFFALLSGSVQITARRTMTLEVPSPPSLAEPIHVPLKTLTGPGPSNVSDRVLKAQSLPTLGHLHPEFTKVTTLHLFFNSCKMHFLSNT